MKWSDEQIEGMQSRLLRILKRAHSPLTFKDIHGRVFDLWGPRTTRALIVDLVGEGLVSRLTGAGPYRADLYGLTEAGRLQLEVRQ